jgi:hypothetical protein
MSQYRPAIASLVSISLTVEFKRQSIKPLKLEVQALISAILVILRNHHPSISDSISVL